MTEFLDLRDYIEIAAEITGLPKTTIERVAKLGLADSALHAPAAGFGGSDHYPDFVEKAAVLISRLAGNHPLPDGNKRVAWVSMRLFIAINGWSWRERPTIDEAERFVVGIAGGELDETAIATWLRSRLDPPPSA